MLSDPEIHRFAHMNSYEVGTPLKHALAPVIISDPTSGSLLIRVNLCHLWIPSTRRTQGVRSFVIAGSAIL